MPPEEQIYQSVTILLSLEIIAPGMEQCVHPGLFFS